MVPAHKAHNFGENPSAFEEKRRDLLVVQAGCLQMLRSNLETNDDRAGGRRPKITELIWAIIDR
jgi:hypothetical protein